MVNKDKKFIINEGRAITNGKFAYGGFPRILSEEGGATEAFRDDNQGDVATRPGEAVKIKLLHGMSGKEHEFDVATDEGLTQALQLIHDNRFTADMADSFSNLSALERQALAQGKEHSQRLKDLAKQRKLKVTYQGFSKPFEVDYGAGEE